MKSLSCLYLDKPLKAHTLMQAIARANRVDAGKSNGLIIDYIGIVKPLRKALADYTATEGEGQGGDPTVDKEQLVERIHETIAQATDFLAAHGFDLQRLIEAHDFEKLALVREGANAVCGTLQEKKTYQTYATELIKMFKYIDREDVDNATRRQKNAIVALHDELCKKRKHADNTDLMVEINRIVSDYVTVEPAMAAEPDVRIDISRIDFDLLRREFAKTREKKLVLKDLKDLIAERIARMMAHNPARIQFYQRYQDIINEYNKEQDRATIEKTFMQLMDLSSSLSEEEQRYVREGFKDDEQLTIYDLLFSDNLSKQDIEKVKKVAKDLLAKIKKQIATLDHWTDKPQTMATVEVLIRDTLWAELPPCYEDIDTYRNRVFEYVYTRYKEVVA